MTPGEMQFLLLVGGIIAVLWGFALIMLPIKVWEMRSRMEALIKQLNDMEQQQSAQVELLQRIASAMEALCARIEVEGGAQ